MNLEISKYYKIVINVHGRIIEYNGKIININSSNFYLKTNDACNLEFNFKDIISIEKISMPKKNIPIIYAKKKKIPRHLLKKQFEPKF